MEIASSALTGALRVGLQVLVARKRPVLEVYQNVHNDFGPPFEYDLHDHTGSKVLKTEKHRFQSIFIDLTLINIGGVRAENVHFEVTGTFKREPPRDHLPELFAAVVTQMAPGQTMYLMRIDDHDLHTYEWEESGNSKVGKAAGIKSETMTIAVHYDGPATLLNRVLRFPRKLRGMKQYSDSYTFDPKVFIGDLPPPKYN